MSLYLLDKPVPSFLPLLSYGVTGYPQNHYLLFKSFTGLLIKQFDDTYLSNDRIKIPNMIKHLLSRRKDRKREREKEQ